eukprot:COSAG05_NODE_4822_length_1358_cov_40.370929_4_plen_44_part_01
MSILKGQRASYPRQMCRTRTRVLENVGEYPIFVLGHVVVFVYQP